MWVSPLRAKALTPHTHVGKNEATPHIEREIARETRFPELIQEPTDVDHQAQQQTT